MTHETTNDPALTRTFVACGWAMRVCLGVYLFHRLMPLLEPPRPRRYAFLATGRFSR